MYISDSSGVCNIAIQWNNRAKSSQGTGCNCNQWSYNSPCQQGSSGKHSFEFVVMELRMADCPLPTADTPESRPRLQSV